MYGEEGGGRREGRQERREEGRGEVWVPCAVEALGQVLLRGLLTVVGCSCRENGP